MVEDRRHAGRSTAGSHDVESPIRLLTSSRMETEQTLVEDEHLKRWAAAVTHIRASELLLSRMIDPRPESDLARADLLYPSEKASAWARSYVDAGCEHLSLWANSVKPRVINENTGVHVVYRPYLLLARAGLESAAHGVWLLTLDDHTECLKRHLRMTYKDIGHFIDARQDGQLDGSKIVAWRKTLVDRAKEALPAARPTDSPPGYQKLVREAATVQGKDPDRWAYLWNLASGAAHGQNWFSYEGYLLKVGEEYEPGYHRVSRLPDVELLTEIIEAAVATLRQATLLWAGRAGYSYQDMYLEAMREVIWPDGNDHRST